MKQNINTLLPPSLQKKKKKDLRIMFGLALLIVLTFLISLNVGYSKLTPIEVFHTFMGNGTVNQNLILFDFRLPRMVLSVLIGAGLAISGCVLQGISRNDLADPGILGINAGAGFAVVLFITFMPATAQTSIFVIPFLAFIGAIVAAALIYLFAFTKHEGVTPITLVLTGVAMATGISAAMIVLTLRLSPENYQFVSNWLTGSIWGTNWNYVLTLLPWIILLIPFVYRKSEVLNVLRLGDQLATGLGAHLERERRILLIVAAGLAGAVVSVGGGIGFVGLLAPHLARQIVGSNYRVAIPVSALLGALLVLFSDMLGRGLLPPSEIPVGIVVAVIGAPYFLYLLMRTKM